MTTQSKTTLHAIHFTGEWSMTSMLRRALLIGGREGISLATYAFRSAGIMDVRTKSTRPASAAQVAALRFFMRRCPLAVDPQCFAIANAIGALP